MDAENVLNSRLIERFEAHRDFTKVFLDAFVLINKEHIILKFNSAFCQIVEQRAVDVRRIARLDDLLTTQVPDQNHTAIDQILKNKGPTRIDEVPAINVVNQKNLILIISSYPYYDDNDELLGACILMRDVTAEMTLQSKYKDKSLESITDPLTGLYTRRYFESQLDKELARCKANNVSPSIAVLMFDLDKFKSVNDTYGHQAGDFVLVETAKILRANSRRSDILGRYGGEELLILLFDVSDKVATAIAETSRLSIQSHDYIYAGKRIPVTTSVGVAMLTTHNELKEAVVKRADECLYHAKANGRNVVVVDYGTGKKLAREYLETKKS